MESDGTGKARPRRSRPGFVRGLTDVEREILHRAIDSQRISEIAGAVDLTPAEARYQLQHAVEKLLQSVYPMLVVGGRNLRTDREAMGVFLSRGTGERVIRRAIAHAARLSLSIALIEVVWTIGQDPGRLVGEGLGAVDALGQKAGHLLFPRLRPEDRCVRWAENQILVLLENTDGEQAEMVVKRLASADEAVGFGIAAVVRHVGEPLPRTLDRLHKAASHALMEDSVRQTLARAHRFS